MSALYTIGHSTHPIERFVELLAAHSISAVADVRSAPYSKFNPQYNRELLARSLSDAGVEYVFLGKELGARPVDSRCYVDGKVRFDLIAKSPVFSRGLERLQAGMESHRVALLCAEKDPVTCHRMILVCRHARSFAGRISHILEDGSLEDNAAAQRRLMQVCGIQENDLFSTDEELVERAYDRQAGHIAYTEKDDG